MLVHTSLILLLVSVKPQKKSFLNENNIGMEPTKLDGMTLQLFHTVPTSCAILPTMVCVC